MRVHLILIATIATAACGNEPGDTSVTTIITTTAASATTSSSSDTDESTTTTSTTTTTENPTSSGSTSGTTTTTTTENTLTSSSSSTTGEPPPGACGDPGSLFGDCIDGVGCLGNFGCYSAKAGQICIPTATYALNNADEVEACVRQVGGVGLDCDTIAGWCLVGCSGACADGITCDDNIDACVHPY